MKNTFFRLSFLLLLAVPVLCLTACKVEPNLPADPHIPLVNTFIGVWLAEDGKYWEFRTDGTGGRADAEEGPFSDDFSFLFFDGKGPEEAGENIAPPSLVIIEGSPVTVTCYKFSIENNRAVLSEFSIDNNNKRIFSGSSITMEQISGEPQVISLTNQLIGEWSVEWTGTHNPTGTLIWSIKYYADGTVKTYHHGFHQFENAYALHGNTLVIFGAWRFSFVPIIADISQLEDGTFQATETQLSIEPYALGGWAYAGWVYTKVDTAQWK